MGLPTFSRARGPSTVMLVSAMLAGCGTGAPGTPVPADTAIPMTPAASPSPESTFPADAASPSPVASPTLPVIDPGDVDQEPPLGLVWQATDPTGEPVPFHPSIDPAGRIWVGAMGENRFLIFDRDGEYIESWGTSGIEEGQFHFMPGPFGGIAFASDGSFFVSDSGNRRIQKFSPEREFVAAWGSFGTGDDQFLTPNEIAVDGEDNVYVHDDELTVTKMFTSDGEFIRTFAEGSAPFVSITEGGHVLAVMWETNHLHEYAPDGSLVRAIDLNGLVALPRAAGVVVDDDGHMWISSVIEDGPRDDPDKLIELDRDGRLLHRWDGMAVTQFVMDPGGDRLYAAFWRQPFLAAYAISSD